MVTAKELLEQLRSAGAATLTDPEGKKLFLVLSSNLGEHSDYGMLVAYEGKGSIFYRPGQRITKFTLYSAGFSIMVAPTVLDVINQLFSIADQPKQIAQRPDTEE